MFWHMNFESTSIELLFIYLPLLSLSLKSESSEDSLTFSLITSPFWSSNFEARPLFGFIDKVCRLSFLSSCLNGLKYEKFFWSTKVLVLSSIPSNAAPLLDLSSSELLSYSSSTSSRLILLSCFSSCNYSITSSSLPASSSMSTMVFAPPAGASGWYPF